MLRCLWVGWGCVRAQWDVKCVLIYFQLKQHFCTPSFYLSCEKKKTEQKKSIWISEMWAWALMQIWYWLCYGVISEDQLGGRVEAAPVTDSEIRPDTVVSTASFSLIKRLADPHQWLLRRHFVPAQAAMSLLWNFRRLKNITKWSNNSSHFTS